MGKEIIVNYSDEEIRIALLEEGLPLEFFIERKEDKKIVGNIYKGVVENILPGIQSAFINIGLGKNAYLDFSDIGGKDKKELIPGKEILVQISKEAISTKGVKVTRHISLPGRCLVYIPNERRVGISRLITDRRERERLRESIKKFLPKDNGCIIRTEAEGVAISDLKREGKFLINLWKSIEKRGRVVSAPSLVHKDLGLVFKVVRDVLSLNVDFFIIDSQKEYEAVLEFTKQVLPHLKNKIKLYQEKVPIFEKYNLEKEMEKLEKPKVVLPSKGYIIIQETEALCAIDVNTGRFIGKKNSEETSLIVNLEAAEEIAHQIRLRNIGGIIIIDFVGMHYRKNKQKVFSALGNAIKKDKAKIKIVPVDHLGLVAMTRERKRESIINVLCDSCFYCGGTGKVTSVKTMYIKIKKEIVKIAKTPGIRWIKVELPSQVAGSFSEEVIRELEKEIQREIKIKSNTEMHIEDYKISPWI